MLAYVSNNGYLDNATFRGMRQQLMSAFSDIYILNLHGNSRKREQTPEGGADENVFDIQQGVAIGIFVKNPSPPAPIANEIANEVRPPTPDGERGSTPSSGRVYINPQQYFEGITPEIWEFQIGGYQVLEKWLKDRRGRTLSFEDIMHDQRIVTALAETDRIWTKSTR